MVNDIQYMPYVGKSYHVCLVFNTNMYAQTDEKCKLRYAYHRGNYQKFITKARDLNTENSCTRFEDILTHEMEENIPKSR